MLFLIDENLPRSFGSVFEKHGWIVEFVAGNTRLRGQSDEVIFKYAVEHDTVIVTRDVGFANTLRFDLPLLRGMVLIRFPNEVASPVLCKDVSSLISTLEDEFFVHKLVVIEPGFIRIRILK